MTKKNRYFFRSRISERKFKEIIKLFVADLTAAQIAFITGINRNTINNILKKMRERIAEICDNEGGFDGGEIEMDESYFGARRIRGLRGRGARGKTIVFGIKKRGDKVYTQVVKNCSKAEILPLIRKKIGTNSSIFTDGFKTYDSLVDLGYKKHYRVYHGSNQFAKKEGKIRNHINGIENFWGIAKVRLYKFRGMDKKTFYLHLKECEFRFNNRHDNLYMLVIKILKNKPLNYKD